MKYIHYGSNAFDPLRWAPIKNKHSEGLFTKPTGGIWASPTDAKLGWAEWCRQQDFHLDGLKESFEFEIAESARILRITSEEVAKSLPLALDDPKVNAFIQPFSKLNMGISLIPIDFELLSKKYDVIEFIASNFFLPNRVLNGWDCDCILVMNKDIICTV